MADATSEQVRQAAGEPDGRGAFELSPHEVGRRGEQICAQRLQDLGFTILERNWVCPFGEADIIAEHEGALVMVEVKTRVVRGDERDSIPELAVDAQKVNRYRRMAHSYLTDHPEYETMRFDVMAVNVVGEHQARLRHLVGIFEICG